MKLIGGSSTRRPPPPALPPPRPVMVVLVDLNVNRNEAWRVERRPFGIEGQVLDAESCRVELVTVGGVARSLSRSSELGGLDACPAENGAKIIAGPNTAGSHRLEAWGPPAMLLLPGAVHMQLQAESGQATRRQGPSPS